MTKRTTDIQTSNDLNQVSGIIDIRQILSRGERVTLECKKALRSIPNSLWDTYSAFANTYGGTILLGVVEHIEERDRSKRFEIVGVEDVDKIRKDLWNTVNSKEKVNVNLLRDDGVQHKAVREAVTNMIIHSDFMVNGILRIEKYDDRIVLTNPGLLKLPIEQIYQGGESKARNQRMQNMFRMIGYGENLGSGFPLILNAWNEKHWIKPELVEQPELMQVKLTLYFENDPVNDPVNEELNLTDRQRLILRLFSDDKTLTRERLCDKTGMSDSTAKREIAYLKKWECWNVSGVIKPDIG